MILMNALTRISSWIFLHWRTTAVIGCAVIGVSVYKRLTETDELRAQRATRQQDRELRILTDKICGYARDLHRRYPTGDVVVSEADLAQRLRKPPNVVVTALNMLLDQARVQRAPLSGYWKLNV
jgi:hypothetical protein